MTASCATCCYFRAPPAEDDAAVAARRSAAAVIVRGACVRHPATVHKQGHEVCGEHPELLSARVLSIAETAAAVFQPLLTRGR